MILQGRGDADTWVKTVKICYTVNGKEWESVDGGKVFNACNDRNSKIRVPFS